jgi:hypothetical protein
VRTQRRHGLPIENPLIFYPRRLAEALTAGLKWLALSRKYNRMVRDIRARPDALTYLDDATRPLVHDGVTEQDQIVEAFADKIPATHGAPKKTKDQTTVAA